MHLTLAHRVTYHVQEEYLEMVTAPTTRPAIVIPVNAHDNEGQLDDNIWCAIPFVQVLSDGLCLYYCALACHDLPAWLGSHTREGFH